MFRNIYEQGGPKKPDELYIVTLDIPKLVSEDDGEPTRDTEPVGRLMVGVPTRCAVLTLEGARALRDALTEHLSNYPEPTPVPVNA